MPQPEKQLNPGESPQAWFGAELRFRRKAQEKMSARQLGRLVQASDDVILAIEKGRYPSCQLPLARRLDEVLETGGVFERAWAMAFGHADKKHRDADKPARKPVEVAVEVPAGRMLGSDDLLPKTGSLQPVDRRVFLAASSLAAVTQIDLVQLVSPRAPAQLPQCIRPRDVEQILGIASDIHRWDNTYGGGGMVRDAAARAMQWATALLYSDCPEVLRPELFAAVSRLGIVVGASAFDSYAHDDARRTFEFAADCAEKAGDWHLRAKTYSFLARQAVWIGKPDDGLTQAEKGLVRADRLTATERAMLHAARARAFAKLGNVQETLSAVGAADEAFSHARPEDDPPWMAYYDEAQHCGDTAHALFDLAVFAGQDPAQAGRRFQRAVAGHGDTFQRSRAISRTKLASLVMAKGDPRQAAQIGHDALDEAGRLTSRRAADDLRQLGGLAGKHPKVTEAVDLRDRIAATVRA